MAQLFRNNAVTTLSAQLNAGATSMALTDAASFPDPGADFYLATLVNVNGSGQETAWEIVRVTAKAGSTLTVTRAQESTTDVTWPAGTPVQMRLTAGSMDGKAAAAHTHAIADTTGLQAALDAKQDTLVSGTNIKTVNGTTLLGSGNLAVGDVLLASANAFTGANAFRNASGQLFQASTTVAQDGIIVNGRAGGTGTFRVTLAPGTLGANRAVTFGDFAGTVVLDTATQTLTNKTLTAPVISTISNTGTLTLPTSTDTLVGRATTDTLTNKTISGGVYSGVVDQTGSVRGGITAMGALQIDCSAGNYFTKTINGASTFTVANVPSGKAYAFTLELTHTSGTVEWFSGVEWPGGTTPSLTTGKTHLFTFVTDDGGTRWRGVASTNYTN